jgi:large subunit ribosomal protein L3
MLGLIGKKVGMTRIFDDNGMVIPVTVIEAGPCRVTQIKTKRQDGYNALQMGFGSRKEKNINKPMKGHLAKAAKDFFPETLGEFRMEDVGSYELGQELSVEMFEAGDGVDVGGVTKGKGFQGVIKRHGFSGGDATHGNTAHRVPGAIGMSADPARVWKGKKLPGQHGNAAQKTINLVVAKVDAESNRLFVKGAVPGPASGFVTVFKKK